LGKSIRDKLIRAVYQSAATICGVVKCRAHLNTHPACTGEAMALDMIDSVSAVAESHALSSTPLVNRPPVRQRLVVALDKPRVDEARELVTELGPTVEVYKVGLELVFAGGLAFAHELKERGKLVFLDMKLLDIGNTVEKAVANVVKLGFDFLTVHAHDQKTLRAAVRGRNSADTRPGTERLKLLGVTVLTNLTQDDLLEQGLRESATDLAVRRALMAYEADFDGVIASGHETAAIRKATDPNFIIKVPGIRPKGSAMGDQQRIMTPTEAIREGASYLVVGRPIADARHPEHVAKHILEEIAAAN
jgi:orotidine-5'-phosphate decarboxylase